MKVLLLGAGGLLGTELTKRYGKDIIAVKKQDCDIISILQVERCIKRYNPDIIINAAAVTDNRVVESDPTGAIMTNIIGSAHLSLVCIAKKIRYVYLSTDYIYKGDRGNYKETDEIMPFNLYSHTKLGGECSAVAVKNHLIIRTSFGGDFKYKKAFIDKWTSKDYVSVLAPMIYEAAISPLTGVLNLGTERKTLFDHAFRTNPNVEAISIKDQRYFTPEDTSLNIQKWIDYTSESSVVSVHKNCRCCGSTNMSKYLDLNLMPLANNLEFTSQRAKDQERYPLQILYCNDCSLSQLSVVIEPKKMFSYYTYRSGINKPYVEHCYNMAQELLRDNLPSRNFLHIDIAGNDGTLLKEFKKYINQKVKHFDGKFLNVDPASNLTAIAESEGIPCITDFWSCKVADHVVQKYGKADLITATNVFAHVDNVHEFLQAASDCLADEGILVIECPYIVDFIENIEFDTTYYEHLSYISVLPVYRMVAQHDLKLIDVQKVNIHGGTIRMTISKIDSVREINYSVFEFMSNEKLKGFHNFETYEKWSEKVDQLVGNLKQGLLSLKKDGKKIAAFAASAKGNTLLNYSDINTDVIDYIVDQTPEKIGKYSPGTGIPIVGIDMVEKDVPDYIVILAWNFKDAIIEKLRKVYKGKFIIPIPKWEIIE